MDNFFSDLLNFAYIVKFDHEGIRACCMANIACWKPYSRKGEKDMKL
jgi:hypothetical protein